MKRTKKKFNLVRGPTLEQLIADYEALPNWRQRWCTRLIKIQPAIAFLLRRPGSTLSVGLRADEEERVGLYGGYATYRYPLREWGWDEKKVWAYLNKRGVTIPKRTDCAWCYGQRLGEWYRLWKQYPELYEQGAALERQTGYTFRSSGRDTWPASLDELAREFCKGRVTLDGRDVTGAIMTSDETKLFKWARQEMAECAKRG